MTAQSEKCLSYNHKDLSSTWKADVVTCIVIPVLGIEAGGYLGLTTSGRLSGEA